MMSVVNYNTGINMICKALGSDVQRIYVYDLSIDGKHTGDGEKMEYYVFQVELCPEVNETEAENILYELFAGNEHFSAILYSPFFENEKRIEIQ